jgi:single-stranded-DNA-specific exonuclease
MLQKRILRRPSLPLAEGLSDSDQLLSQIFNNRGAQYQQSKNYSLADLHSPKLLKGVDQACELLLDSLAEQSSVVIVGDFDADGATSTAVLMRSLENFGFERVAYIVPNRFEYGYGLSPKIVDLAAQYSPDLIITVDNGISSIEGVQYAKDKGIRVIVTDHHLPGKKSPAADAIVNPNQLGCEFPSKNLAGVGVIFYVMLALRGLMRDRGYFKSTLEPNLAQYLDLVALGTVADVVPLDHNNRILVAQGLKRIRAAQCCAGIQALFKISNRNMSRASAGDFGFSLGPRLNAAGRLDDMSRGIQCLLSAHYHEALLLAQTLEDLNAERKAIEASMKVEAMRELDNIDESESASGSSGLCLYREDWHQGVVGILASRVKDRIHRPAIVFSKNDDDSLKGSGRSIKGIHLRDVLDEIASSNPGLIEKFGGHAMAAGLSIQERRYQEFAARFDEVVGQYLQDDMKEPIIYSDGQLPRTLFSQNFALQLRDAGPWGQAFPEPVFDGVFRVVDQKPVGGGAHLKLVLTPEEFSGILVDAIAFNIEQDQWPNPKAHSIKAAYQLDVNEWQGNESLQLRIEYLELA